MAVSEKHIGIYTCTTGTIKKTEARIVHHPGTKRLEQKPYHVVLKSREVLEQHMHTKLDSGIIGPAEMKRTSVDDSPTCLSETHCRDPRERTEQTSARAIDDKENEERRVCNTNGASDTSDASGMSNTSERKRGSDCDIVGVGRSSCGKE